ncbi:ABC transporter substrate-binding protein [Paenibacillus lemnae]|uniref:Carbohydrate ABC transporter substrate-binding protein n=1 Tax=Paenibacillus lemnae TaxID=1330551 RepID=A0A848MDD3_PAELE|nr:ABC transporter substrate-binding protein [Paenibacillus lemnae]NMO98093.1 carbohydrate ABC transporter substrate-binding protein [Paenibacillus lemnae]
MKKKYGTLALVMVLALSALLAGCGGSKESGGTAGSGGEGTKTLKIFQFKVEIAEALNQMKAEYEKEHPGIKLDIQTVGGGSDYASALKAKFASGDEPDLFNVSGYRDLDTWFEKVEDLSDQPWVDDVVDVAKEPMTKDGKLYGQPMAIEGYGIIYNKNLFQQAGITELPTTLSELEAAARQLQEAGITPFVNGYQENWILANHLLNIGFAHQEDPDGFVKSLNEGKGTIKGNGVMDEWINLFDLTMKYGQKNPLTTDYNTEITTFATGEAAMTQNGNWTQVQIDGINPELNIGLLPMPINDNAEQNDKLPVGVPNNWVVNKNSGMKDEAKEFLNWLVTSETGKKYITEDFKFIPAFKSIEANSELLGDLGTDVMKYSQDGKALSWEFNKFPDGGMNEFGSIMQGYVAGNVNKDQLFEALDQAWADLKAK